MEINCYQFEMTGSEQKRSGLLSPSNDIFSLKRLLFVLLLIFFNISNAQISFSKSSDGEVMIASNCDFTGNDIGSVTNTNSAAQCGVSCAGNPNCYYFTYNPTTLTCWLKKQAFGTNSAANSPGASCGYVIARPISEFNFVSGGSGLVKIAPGCDFAWNDIGSATVPNADQCGLNCALNPNCDHFTYNPSTTTCYLKKPVPAGSNKVATSSPGASCGYVTTRPTCDCDYFSPAGGIKADVLQLLFDGGSGCKVSKSAPSGLACKCSYKGAYTCGGTPTTCANPGRCVAPLSIDNLFGLEYCLQGQGDCDGAQVQTIQSSNPLPCDCDYHSNGIFSSGGCKVVIAPPRGYACRCKYGGAWTCGGKLTLCNDVNNAKCQNPDLSVDTCNQGGGDCAGY